MHVLSTRFPNWKDLAIHESSPGWDMVSQRLVNECRFYTASHYDTSVPFGSIVCDVALPCKSYRSEDLGMQTFEDEKFNLVIMQDVFEHIMYPDRAIKEIARTLKPNGATIMTVPIVRKHNSSQRRASIVHGEIKYLLPPQYHGNPLRGGSLVTIDWGYDILHYFQAHSDLMFVLIQVDNIDLGIRADLNDVIIGFKAAVPNLT
jgi:SAM-dependent methyltransferase